MLCMSICVDIETVEAFKYEDTNSEGEGYTSMDN